MKHYGDITQIHGDRVPIVDIITGGSPCQDLSVAGKRQGLDGERSGLFMEQIRIIREMHDECRRTDKPIRPRYMVWENVPGAKSSGTPPGEDFRIVLEETARIADSSASIPRLPSGESWSNAGCILGDGWSIAWRVHDAQFWGVPQRRKRIALVADFRGTSAPEILFERQGLSGNTEQSKEERQGSAENLGGCVNAISFQERAGRDGGVKEYSSKPNEPEHSQHSKISTYVIEGNGTRSSHNGDGYAESDVSYTLNATEQHCIAFSQDAYDTYSQSDVSATITPSGGVYGGGQRVISNTVNSLCAVDYKGAGNQYIEDKKVIINYGRDDE